MLTNFLNMDHGIQKHQFIINHKHGPWSTTSHLKFPSLTQTTMLYQWTTSICIRDTPWIEHSGSTAYLQPQNARTNTLAYIEH